MVRTRNRRHLSHLRATMDEQTRLSESIHAIYGIEPIFEFETRIKCRMQLENITYEEVEETKEKAKLKVLEKFWARTKKEGPGRSTANVTQENFVGKLQNTCLKFKRLGFPNY